MQNLFSDRNDNEVLATVSGGVIVCVLPSFPIGKDDLRTKKDANLTVIVSVAFQAPFYSKEYAVKIIDSKISNIPIVSNTSRKSIRHILNIFQETQCLIRL